MKQKRLQIERLAVLGLILNVVLLGCASSARTPEHPENPDDHSHAEDEPGALLAQAIATAGLLITHIHGIGYSADGQRLLLAAHDGLKVYESGEWAAADAPHDFMGFTAVEGGFFSSGHPAANSGLPNPLGFVFVDGTNWTLSMLGFQNDLDFHFMAAGYFSRTVYLVNTQASATLRTGLFVTNDGGENWHKRPGTGLKGTIRQIAVHPTDPLVSAYATSDGLYVSVDGGESANRWIDRVDGYAVAFSSDGERIYYGGTDLEYRDLTRGGGTLGPAPSEGIITHIAVNPLDARELTAATAAMRVIRSVDGGITWRPILLDGREP